MQNHKQWPFSFPLTPPEAFILFFYLKKCWPSSSMYFSQCMYYVVTGLFSRKIARCCCCWWFVLYVYGVICGWRTLLYYICTWATSYYYIFHAPQNLLLKFVWKQLTAFLKLFYFCSWNSTFGYSTIFSNV